MLRESYSGKSYDRVANLFHFQKQKRKYKYQIKHAKSNNLKDNPEILDLQKLELLDLQS